MNTKILIFEELLKKDDFFINKFNSIIHNNINEKIQQKIIECWANTKHNTIENVLNSDEIKKITSSTKINTQIINELRDELLFLKNNNTPLSKNTFDLNPLINKIEPNNIIEIKNDIDTQQENLNNIIDNSNNIIENKK